MARDDHGQAPNTNLCAARNTQKALHSLKGILQGVTANDRLSEQELLFLDAWLRSQEFLKHDEDATDLLHAVESTLSNGSIEADKLESLHALVDDILTLKPFNQGDNEARINELIGLISGIAADNRVEDSEVFQLAKWLINNKDMAEQWPLCTLNESIAEILDHNPFRAEDRESLLEQIKRITGCRFEETGIAHGTSTEFYEDNPATISYQNTKFCFTGAFVSGNRKAVEAIAKAYGAKTTSGVSKMTDYLVIGTLASRDWMYTSHGRKIEQALKLKQEGAKIAILSEEAWITLTEKAETA